MYTALITTRAPAVLVPYERPNIRCVSKVGQFALL
jgi:hypothetical protein